MAQAMTTPAKPPANTNQDSTDASTQAPGDQVPYELSTDKMMTDMAFIMCTFFFIFYFMLIRPQQRRVKTHNDLMKALQKGNKVMTTGGIIGTISKFEGDDVVVLEIAQGVKIRLSRSAVSEVVADKSLGESANDN